jgi:hypothetical protein
VPLLCGLTLRNIWSFAIGSPGAGRRGSGEIPGGASGGAGRGRASGGLGVARDRFGLAAVRPSPARLRPGTAGGAARQLVWVLGEAKDGFFWLAVGSSSELAAAALNGAGGGSVDLVGPTRRGRSNDC